ncbi:MAG: hypothetical protein ACXWUG_17475 [Polyangiales bacterium]
MTIDGVGSAPNTSFMHWKLRELGLSCAILALGCGARTGLFVPDGGTQSATTDAVVDGGVDVDPVDSDFVDSALTDSGLSDIGLADAPLPKPVVDFDVPFEMPPTPDKGIVSSGTASIKQVDVAVVVDTTGSMAGSIENLRTNLKTKIIPGIAAAIPSLGLAVVDQKDYPVGAHGTFGDFPVKVLHTVTPEVGLAQSALDKMTAVGGGDGPEAQIPAMWHVLTGNELRWAGGVVPKHVPAPGTVGGVDFRPGSLRIVVLVTDVDWHDCADYEPTLVFSPPCFSALSLAFRDNNARFVNVTSLAGGSFLENQANRLSDETASNIPPSAFACGGSCCTGLSGTPRPPAAPGGRCRLNFLHENGNGVSDSIVSAIQAISTGSTFDVIAQVVDDPSDAVDATKFVKTVRAMDEGDATKGCAPAPAKDTNGDGVKDTFTSVDIGTHVCFEVIPAMNTTVKPTDMDQYFLAVLQVLGMPGMIRLDTQTIRFRVPKLDTPDAGTD